MEINNSPSISLIPVVLGEKAVSQAKTVENNAVEKVNDKPANAGGYPSRLISESEKQTAQQQFQSGQAEQEKDNLFKDQYSASENKAVNAYLDIEQADKKNYLSEVLGIDVYT